MFAIPPANALSPLSFAKIQVVHPSPSARSCTAVNGMLLGQCCTTEQSPVLLHASKYNGGKDFYVLGLPFP